MDFMDLCLIHHLVGHNTDKFPSFNSCIQNLTEKSEEIHKLKVFAILITF